MLPLTKSWEFDDIFYEFVLTLETWPLSCRKRGILFLASSLISLYFLSFWSSRLPTTTNPKRNMFQYRSLIIQSVISDLYIWSLFALLLFFVARSAYWVCFNRKMWTKLFCKQPRLKLNLISKNAWLEHPIQIKWAVFGCCFLLCFDFCRSYPLLTPCWVTCGFRRLSGSHFLSGIPQIHSSRKDPSQMSGVKQATFKLVQTELLCSLSPLSILLCNLFKEIFLYRPHFLLKFDFSFAKSALKCLWRQNIWMSLNGLKMW